jgi:hypothetical protein
MRNYYIKMRNIITRSSILFTYEQIIIYKYYDCNYHTPNNNFTMTNNFIKKLNSYDTIYLLTKKIVTFLKKNKTQMKIILTFQRNIN